MTLQRKAKADKARKERQLREKQEAAAAAQAAEIAALVAEESRHRHRRTTVNLPVKKSASHERYAPVARPRVQTKQRHLPRLTSSHWWNEPLRWLEPWRNGLQFDLHSSAGKCRIATGGIGFTAQSSDRHAGRGGRRKMMALLGYWVLSLLFRVNVTCRNTTRSKVSPESQWFRSLHSSATNALNGPKASKSEAAPPKRKEQPPQSSIENADAAAELIAQQEILERVRLAVHFYRSVLILYPA